MPDTVPGDDSDQNTKPARSQVTLYALNSKHMYLFFLQAAIDLLSDFFPHIDNMLHTMIARGAHPSAGQHCCDGDTVRLHRCRDCFDGHPVCRKCITEAHHSNPFHAIESWTGTHFRKSSLIDLDFKLYLMHSGKPCPHADPRDLGQRIEVVHTNGIHFLRIFQCSCPGAPSNLLQYTHCKLLPSTPQAPRVLFTFDLMKDFHVHSLTSKKSAFDYIAAIRRKTNALVSDVTVRFCSIDKPWQ